MPFGNRLSLRLDTLQPSREVQQGDETCSVEVRSVKEWAKDLVKVKNSAMVLYKQHETFTLVTRLNRYIATLNENGDITVIRKDNPALSWGMRIKQIVLKLFTNYDLRIARVNSELSKQIQQLRFKDKQQAAIAEAHTKQNTTIKAMNESVSKNSSAELLRNNLKKLLANITNITIQKMEREGSQEQLDSLKKTYNGLSESLQSVLEKFADEDKFDNALCVLLEATNRYGGFLETVSEISNIPGMPNIMDSLFKDMIEIDRDIDPYEAFISLAETLTEKNYYDWVNGNPCFTAIIRYTLNGKKARAVDALRENDWLKEAFITHLNRLPGGSELSVENTPLEITRAWIAVSRAS